MWKILATLLVYLVATTVNANEYQAGQLWSYKARPGDESSVLLINLVEPHDKLGPIYHISVLQVHMPSLKDSSRPLMDLPHFPVSKATLDKSVVALVGKRAILSDYRTGYGMWREAFDAGRAGVFTLSVAEIVGTIEETVKKQKR